MSGESTLPLSLCSLIKSLSVPMSRLPEIIAATQLDIKEAGITSTIVGHVGQSHQRVPEPLTYTPY